MWQDKYEALTTITEELNKLNQELLRSPAAAELRNALAALGEEYPALLPQVVLQFRFASDDQTDALLKHEFGLQCSNVLGIAPFERHYSLGRLPTADRALMTALSELSLDHQMRDNAAQGAEREMDELRRAGQAPSDPQEQAALQQYIAEQQRRESRERLDSWRASMQDRMKSRRPRQVPSALG